MLPAFPYTFFPLTPPAPPAVDPPRRSPPPSSDTGLRRLAQDQDIVLLRHWIPLSATPRRARASRAAARPAIAGFGQPWPHTTRHRRFVARKASREPPPFPSSHGAAPPSPPPWFRSSQGRAFSSSLRSPTMAPSVLLGRHPTSCSLVVAPVQLAPSPRASRSPAKASILQIRQPWLPLPPLRL